MDGSNASVLTLLIACAHSSTSRLESCSTERQEQPLGAERAANFDGYKTTHGESL
jgi:hypothetical protein